MQHLLSRAAWDHDAVRDDVRDYLVEHLGDPPAAPPAPPATGRGHPYAVASGHRLVFGRSHDTTIDGGRPRLLASLLPALTSQITIYGWRCATNVEGGSM